MKSKVNIIVDFMKGIASDQNLEAQDLFYIAAGIFFISSQVMVICYWIF